MEQLPIEYHPPKNKRLQQYLWQLPEHNMLFSHGWTEHQSTLFTNMIRNFGRGVKIGLTFVSVYFTSMFSSEAEKASLSLSRRLEPFKESPDCLKKNILTLLRIKSVHANFHKHISKWLQNMVIEVYENV